MDSFTLTTRITLRNIDANNYGHRYMTLREKLYKDAEEFALKNDIALSRLSTIVSNGGTFFEKLAAGQSCTLETYEKYQKVFNDPDAWNEAIQVESDRRNLAEKKRRARKQDIDQDEAA